MGAQKKGESEKKMLVGSMSPAWCSLGVWRLAHNTNFPFVWQRIPVMETKVWSYYILALPALKSLSSLLLLFLPCSPNNCLTRIRLPRQI